MCVLTPKTRRVYHKQRENGTMFHVCNKDFFILAEMKPEVRPEAGTIYDSRPFKSSPTLDAQERELVRQQRAREAADALDEVGAVGVLLDLGDERGADDRGVGVRPHVCDVLR